MIGELFTYASYATALSTFALPAAPTSASPDALTPWELERVDDCDLCGSRSLHELVEQTPRTARTVMCNDCGLLISSPRVRSDTLDDFFAGGFDGDPGAPARLERSGDLSRTAAREESASRTWAIPLIARHMDLNGKKVLDIRGRTGSLAEAMTAAGADVTCLEPLRPNADYGTSVRGAGDMRFVPMSDLARLAGIEGGSVDAVTALTVHVLAHLPSPRRHLSRINEVLKPGGYLFIDEKHALMPSKTVKQTLFGARPVHSYHFTERSMAKYLARTGFEVVECALDKERSSAFRHLRVVARKPLGKPTGEADIRITPEERECLLAEISAGERRLARRRVFNRLLRQARLLAKRAAR